MTTNRNVVAIIGTAGRNQVPTIQEWDYMLQQAVANVSPTDWVVSGGAAWADHLAVQLYLDGLVAGIIIHFPAPFFNSKYVEHSSKSAGSAANYYHNKMSNVLGYNTLSQISEVLACAATDKNVESTFQPAQAGYQGMFARNKLIAESATRMLAFTYAKGDVPADGGTKDTWDNFQGPKKHIPISTSTDFTVRLQACQLHFKTLKKALGDDLYEGMKLEPYALDAGHVHIKPFLEVPVYLTNILQGVNHKTQQAYTDITLYKFNEEGTHTMIPVPTTYINLGDTITLDIVGPNDEYQVTLDHCDIMTLTSGIEQCTITARSGDGVSTLLVLGNHHKLVQFVDSGVYYEPIVKYSRKGGYECSSRGDKRFSAMYAVMPDGRTIEQHYQCDVKGYDIGGTNWKLGKGNPPLNKEVNVAKAYLTLWNQYLNNNPTYAQELLDLARTKDNTLSDMFASTAINQASALACLLSLRIQDGLIK